MATLTGSEPISAANLKAALALVRDIHAATVPIKKEGTD